MSKLIRKSCYLKAVNKNDRTATFIASDASVDRYGDVVEVDGWDTTAFKKNSVFLFGHDSSSFPIGKVLRTWVEDAKFMAKVLFLPEDLDERADKAYRMVQEGFLKAVSVGFIPKKQEPIYDDDGRWKGTHFIEQELLELSLVPIPANSNAVQVARSMEFSQKDLDTFFEPNSGLSEVEKARFDLDLLKLRLSDD